MGSGGIGGKGIALGALVSALGALVLWVATGSGTPSAPTAGPPESAGSEAHDASGALGLAPGDLADDLATAGGQRQRSVQVSTPEPAPAPRPFAPRIFVLDELEQPLPGATIALAPADRDRGPDGGERTWTADERGGVTLPFELDPSEGDGRLALEVSCPGYFHLARRVKVREQMFVMLRRAIPLAGYVIDKRAQSPIAGARLSLPHKDCTDCEPEVVFSGFDGSYRFDGIPVGRRLELVAEAEGYVDGRARFRTEPAAQEAVQSLSLEPGLPVVVEVVDALTGAPLPGAMVKGLKGPFEADAGGRVESDQLATTDDGRARLSAYADGYCQLTVKPTSGSLAAAGVVVLPLVPAVTVEGEVLATDGHPHPARLGWNRKERIDAGKAPDELRGLLSGVKGWSLSAAPGATDASLSVSEDGTFRIEGALPWSWLLLAPPSIQLGAFGPDTTPEPDVHLAGDLHTLLPGPGQTHRVRLEVLAEVAASSGGSLTGRLTLNGEGERGTVHWVGPTDKGLARTDKRGRYELAGVEAGLVELTARSDRLLARSGCALADLAPRAVLVEVGTTTELDLAIELPMTTLSGTAMLSSGAPLAGVEVRAEDAERCWRDEVETDSRGAFELEVPASLAGFDLTAKRAPQTLRQKDVRPGSAGLQFVFAELGQLRFRAVDDADASNLTKGSLDWRWPGTPYQELAKLDHEVPLADGWYEVDCPAGTVDLMLRTRRDQHLPAPLRGVRVYAGAVTEVEFNVRPSHTRRIVFEQGSEELPPDLAVALAPVSSAHRLSYRPSKRRWEGLGKNSPHRELKFRTGGGAVVRGLRPGRYRFAVWPEDHDVRPRELTVKAREPDGTVRVTLVRR